MEDSYKMKKQNVVSFPESFSQKNFFRHARKFWKKEKESEVKQKQPKKQTQTRL